MPSFTSAAQQEPVRQVVAVVIVPRDLPAVVYAEEDSAVDRAWGIYGGADTLVAKKPMKVVVAVLVLADDLAFVIYAIRRTSHRIRRIIKEGILDLCLRDQSGKDNPGLTIATICLINTIKPVSQQSKQLRGIGTRPADFHFDAGVPEFLCPEK